MRLLGAGTQDWVLKPFTVAELIARAGNLATMKRVRDVLQTQVTTGRHDLEALAREVAARKLEAERANQTKDEFLENAAHELCARR